MLTYHREDTAEEVLWEVGFKRCIKVSWERELRKHITRGNNLCKGTATDTREDCPSKEECCSPSPVILLDRHRAFVPNRFP